MNAASERDPSTNLPVEGYIAWKRAFPGGLQPPGSRESYEALLWPEWNKMKPNGIDFRVSPLYIYGSRKPGSIHAEGQGTNQYVCLQDSLLCSLVEYEKEMLC